MKSIRLTPNEAAELYGVSAERVREWCESGLLPSFRSVTGRRKIDRLELIAFARRHPELIAPPKGRGAGLDSATGKSGGSPGAFASAGACSAATAPTPAKALKSDLGLQTEDELPLG